MKKVIILSLILTLIIKFSQAQISYVNFNKSVSLNPHAEHDIKLVADYLQFLTVDGNEEKIRASLDPNAWNFGPGTQDSVSVDQVIQIWKTNYKNQLDRKIENVSMTWRALAEGIYKGDWVANWGIYSYTDKDSGKKIQVSYHYVARIVNGKISFNRVYYDILAPLMASGYHLTPPHSTP